MGGGGGVCKLSGFRTVLSSVGEFGTTGGFPGLGFGCGVAGSESFTAKEWDKGMEAEAEGAQVIDI